MRFYSIVFIIFLTACSPSDESTNDQSNPIPVDLCANMDCGSNGECAVVDNNAVCACNEGYHTEGPMCVADIGTLCENVDCGANGRCDDASGTAACICDTGYHANGLACEIDAVDLCAGENCSDHGTCEVVNEAASCNCNDGYHANGLACEIDVVDLCAGETCSDHGACEVAGGAASCNCDDGYHANGLACEIDVVDLCAGMSCSGNGTCNEGICYCDIGYSGTDCSVVDSNPPTMWVDEQWDTSPPTSWLNDPNSAVGNFPLGAKFGSSLLSFSPVVYRQNGPARFPYYLRFTVPANTNGGDQSDTYFTIRNDAFLDRLGIPLRTGWMRGLRRWSEGNVVGKYHYMDTAEAAWNVPTFDFSLANMVGNHGTGTVGALAFNANTGLWEGLINQNGGGSFDPIPMGTPIVFTSGVNVNHSYSIHSYNTVDGTVTIYPRNGRDWLIPPNTGDSFLIGPHTGESLTFTGAIRSMTGQFIHFNWDANRFGTLNVNEYPQAGDVGTITFSSGIVITNVNVYQSHRRNANDLLPQAAAGQALNMPEINNHPEVLAYMIATVGGSMDVTSILPNGPWNLADNNELFIPNDHENEWVSIEQFFDYSSNPHRWRCFITTEWGYNNLGDGESGPMPGSTSIAGGEIMHFNNVEYLHVVHPAPGLTTGHNGVNGGMNMKWGAYWGNTLNLYPGATEDIGVIQFSDRKLGPAF